ncbi:unnamed protein product [Allacma fusca]|uniref:Uncharacterized protein n=1 Tax=Allacma fusca TaxID=39272 RepID=A0A8J2KH58_9HEXA|nr:unnamed protein product [Allacma fusca]
MSVKDNSTRRASFIMPLIRHNDPGSCGSSNASTSSSNSGDPVDLKTFVGQQQHLARSRSFGGLLLGSGGSCSGSSRRHNNMNSVRYV